MAELQLNGKTYVFPDRAAAEAALRDYDASLAAPSPQPDVSAQAAVPKSAPERSLVQNLLRNVGPPGATQIAQGLVPSFVNNSPELLRSQMNPTENPGAKALSFVQGVVPNPLEGPPGTRPIVDALLSLSPNSRNYADSSLFGQLRALLAQSAQNEPVANLAGQVASPFVMGGAARIISKMGSSRLAKGLLDALPYVGRVREETLAEQIAAKQTAARTANLAATKTNQADVAFGQKMLNDLTGANRTITQEIGKPALDVGTALQQARQAARESLSTAYEATASPLIDKYAQAPVNTKKAVNYIDKVLYDNPGFGSKLGDLRRIRKILQGSLLEENVPAKLGAYGEIVSPATSELRQRPPTLKDIDSARRLGALASNFAKKEGSTEIHTIYRKLYHDYLAPMIQEGIRSSGTTEEAAQLAKAKLDYSTGKTALQSTRHFAGKAPEDLLLPSRLGATEIRDLVNRFPQTAPAIVDAVKYNFSKAKTPDQFRSLFEKYDENLLKNLLTKDDFGYIKQLEQNATDIAATKKLGRGLYDQKAVVPVPTVREARAQIRGKELSPTSQAVLKLGLRAAAAVGGVVGATAIGSKMLHPVIKGIGE